MPTRLARFLRPKPILAATTAALLSGVGAAGAMTGPLDHHDDDKPMTSIAGTVTAAEHEQELDAPEVEKAENEAPEVETEKADADGHDTDEPEAKDAADVDDDQDADDQGENENEAADNDEVEHDDAAEQHATTANVDHESEHTGDSGGSHDGHDGHGDD